MHRVTLIQHLIDKYKYTTYLEIGTQRGLSFFPINCKNKIAVDPNFLFGIKEKVVWIYKKRNNLRNTYFEMTSDAFFQNKKTFLSNFKKLDIILIDGLHTFRATLNDILNSLQYLSSNGIIIVHDCFPPHEAAATKGEYAEEVESRSNSIKGWTGEWCGDTWKAIAYLRKAYPNELKISVLDCDYGLGTIQIQNRSTLYLDLDIELFKEIDNLSYDHLRRKPHKLIGLTKKEEYMYL